MTLLDKIFFLWRTKHLNFNGEKWSNTGFYNGVNNSCGMYYTNASVDEIAKEANEKSIKESDLLIYPSYSYFKQINATTKITITNL